MLVPGSIEVSGGLVACLDTGMARVAPEYQGRESEVFSPADVEFALAVTTDDCQVTVHGLGEVASAFVPLERSVRSRIVDVL